MSRCTKGTTRRNQHSRRRNSNSRKPLRPALVLMNALAIQILGSNMATPQQKAKASGWRGDIRFLGQLKGLWRFLGFRAYERYGVPKEYYKRLLKKVMKRMESDSLKSDVRLCLSVCSWVLQGPTPK